MSLLQLELQIDGVGQPGREGLNDAGAFLLGNVVSRGMKCACSGRPS
jgi:hypothetical protein